MTEKFKFQQIFIKWANFWITYCPFKLIGKIWSELKCMVIPYLGSTQS